MKNFNKTLKLIFTGSIFILLAACSGEVEFDEIPQAISLDTCESESCLEPGEEFIEKAGQTSVTQESTGGQVDILIVVDNSYSMYDEQRKMGERFGDFIRTLRNVDWQVAFTTTDARTNYNSHRFGGRLLNLVGANGSVINKNTANLVQVFKDTIDRSGDQEGCDFGFSEPCASNNEEPLKAITQAIDLKDGASSSFFRNGSALAVIILSDEDEQSIGGRNAIKPNQVIEKVRSSFGASKKFAAYGIIIKPQDQNCLAANQPDGVVATHVYTLANLTGGITRSLCDNDYKPSMKAISHKVMRILKVSEISLPYKPLKKSLKVSFIPESNKVKWALKNKQLVFEDAPANDTEVVVDYLYKVRIKRKKH